MPLKIYTLSLNERARNTLQLFLDRMGSLYCIWGKEASADACIIDMDVFGAVALHEQQRSAYPGRPLILLSLREVSTGEQDWFVRKPIDLRILGDVLEKIRKQMRALSGASTPAPQRTPKGDMNAPILLQRSGAVSRPKDSSKTISRELTHDLSRRLDEQAFRSFCGCTPDIDAADPVQRHNAYYEPQKFLEGTLHSALRMAQRKGKAIRVSGPVIEPILIDPIAQCAWTTMQDRRLRSASIIPLEEGQLEVEVLTSGPDPTAGNPHPLDSFLWKMALWTARGRVPSETDLETPIRLEAWPNFTRLWIPPHALRIAALWSRHPHSLLATARAITVPHRYVFAFYSAAHAVGLAIPTQDTSGMPSPAEPRQQRGLLQRILRHLIPG